MAICRFFLQGACRFGPKCSNEHLDIKQLVKTDLEAAYNGKQWPLSCFGPFKDKPCIPNFIEDQSFEEIRWICYEARQKNCVDNFVQQFNKEAMEANNKMKTMAQMSPHVIDIICRLYDATSDASGNVGLTKSNTNNPFGRGIGIVNDTTSIFNKPAVASSGNKNFGDGFNNHVDTSNAECVFGGMAPSTGGGGSAFSFQNQQSSVFSQQLPNANSIFGGGVPQNALFGPTLTSTAVNGGLFGQAPQGAGCLFTQASQQQQQTPPLSNVGLFSQAAGGGIFNQSIQKQQLPNVGNVFTQSIQSQQIQSPSRFDMYQSNKQQPPSVFGQQNAFLQQTSSSIFGQAKQTTPTSNLNIFSQSSANSTGNFNNNAVAIPAQNVFAQTLPQNQKTPANIFSQPDQTTAATSVSILPPTSFFHQATRSPNQPTGFERQMGENNTSRTILQSPVVSSSAYSKLTDLTGDEIEAFKEEAFTPGKIPNVPPPPELIN